MIPNLDNDMHDGTIAQGDAWLQNNLGAYITWAQTHNSVFILTFDEDEGGAAQPDSDGHHRTAGDAGQLRREINHYSVLRTVQDAYGLAAIGASATASPILDIWAAPAGNRRRPPRSRRPATQLTCTFDARARPIRTARSSATPGRSVTANRAPA